MDTTSPHAIGDPMDAPGSAPVPASPAGNLRVPTGSDLDRIRDALRAFVDARDWRQFHDPKNLAMAVASEAGELLAHFRWTPGERSLASLSDPRTRAAVEEEVADVLLLLVEFADVCGIDLAAAAERKLALNAARYPVEKSRGRSEKYDRLGEPSSGA